MLSNANDLAYLSSEFNSATSVLNSPAKCEGGKQFVHPWIHLNVFNNPKEISLENSTVLKNIDNSSIESVQMNADNHMYTSDLNMPGDHSSRNLSNEKVHSFRDRSLPGILSRPEEVYSVYSVREHRRNTLIRFQDPVKYNSPSPSRQKRRIEIIRCWSREKITRSETILSIRPPSSQQILKQEETLNKDNLYKSKLTASTTAFHTFPSTNLTDHSENSLSMPSSLRYIPIQIIDNHQGNYMITRPLFNNKHQPSDIIAKLPIIKPSDEDNLKKQLNLSISAREYSNYSDNFYFSSFYSIAKEFFFLVFTSSICLYSL
ncbi:unnamed protein product [Heterobilharzia americana]|nr:unnamed protein product [Heterobilharzia americana]